MQTKQKYDPKGTWTNTFGKVVKGVLKEFTVKRSEWLRGYMNNTQLLDHGVRRCCIGFMAAACNVPDNILRHKAIIGDLPNEYRRMVLSDEDFLLREFNRSGKTLDKLTGDEFPMEHETLNRAYCINDDDQIDDSTRERKIAQFFRRRFDVKVIFVD